MFSLRELKATTGLVAVCGGLLSTVAMAPSLAAQPLNSPQNTIEEIFVTGTYIKRSSQFDSPSPLTVLGADDLSAQGFTSAGDIARNLTINNGAELNTDAFTQNFSSGTANINLRGLGLSSTLVLLNGRRQTLSGAYADDGDTFVDTNSLVPLIMVDRVEILKDGAAALYGTDAVAGVVNYITRDSFRGVELDARLQSTTESGQRDVDIGAIAGFGNDRVSLVAAMSYTNRTELLAGQREFTRGSGISSSGQPGSVFGLVPGNPGFPLIDPACGSEKNSIPHILSPMTVAGFHIGTCDFDFSEYYSLVPKEDRLLGYLTGKVEFSDAIQLFGEFGYSRNRATRANAPSFPVASPILVSGAHPGNPFPAALWPKSQPRPVLSRLLGGNSPASPSHHDSDTYRAVGGLRGDITPRWSWEAAVTYSHNKFALDVEDVVTDRYLAALTGHGGPNGNQWFNPFGTSIGATPDQVGVFNDPAVIHYILQKASVVAETSLWTVDAHVSGSLFSLPAGDLGIAVGGQFRREKMSYDWNDLYNQKAFLFLVGGPDFAGDRNVYAGFVELAIPVLPNLEIQAAARYEDYGDGVNTTDPKVAVLWRPVNTLTVRGSFGTSFRAPSLFQTLGSKTSLANIHYGVASSFLAVTTRGNPDLVPQEADVYNAGISWRPDDRFIASIDYWRFKYKNLIVQEDAQAVVDAAVGGNAAALSKLTFEQGALTQVHVDFINSPRVTTDGLDISASYTWPTSGGFLRLGADATYVFKYDAIDQNGVPFDGAGRRNFGTFARSIPQWRGNGYLTWNHGNHLANVIVRYIDSYFDNENNVKLASHTTVDVQYSYILEGLFTSAGNTTLTVGAINLFDQNIPKVNTFGGFDSKVHDPRGRLVYIGIKQGF